MRMNAGTASSGVHAQTVQGHAAIAYQGIDALERLKEFVDVVLLPKV
jgi:hypothetical protein